MRLAFAACAVLGLGLGGCDNGKSHLHPEAGMDAAPPPWWRATLGEAKDWDIQLASPFELTARNTMYDLNLWDVVPSARTLEYGDPTPISVPAGVLPTAIADLHARNVKVVCHFDTGAIHLTKDPDAKKFPGYKATGVPNRETPPEPGSVIGWSVLDTGADDDHRYLDIREASRTTWLPLMLKRFDLAKEIGCDGIDGDQNLSISNTDYSGFHIEVAEQVSWYREVAKQAHERVLAVGMRNGQTLPSLVDTVAADYDFMMVERCGQYGDCGNTRPFIQLQRVVFAIDYVNNEGGMPNLPASICQEQQKAQISEGLIKDDKLTGAKREPCTP